MKIVSIEYFIFLNLLLVGYYTIFAKWQWQYLLAASIIAYFFMAASPYTILYLVFTVLSVYVASRMICGQCKHKRLIFWLTLGLNFGLLLGLKYTNFFISNVNSCFSFIGIQQQLSSVDWAVSLGISYYTFSAMGYLIKLYWGGEECEKNLGKLALFISFFPLLISGPICRYEQVAEDLFKNKRFDYTDFCFGAQRILWGMFKKVVVSERFAILVNTISSDLVMYRGVYVVIAICGFVIQLYADFSGCMDIVLGSAELFGIHLLENFRQPLFSKSIQEFWQRWHMTLGEWTRDYILYPLLKTELCNVIREKIKVKLGKKWAKKLPTYLAMLVVWMVMGIWHGAGWKFIIGTGFYFWMLMVFEDLFTPTFQKLNVILHINEEHFLWKIWQCIRTFILVGVGCIAFWAKDFPDIFFVLKCAISRFNLLECMSLSSVCSMGLDFPDLVVACIGVLMILVVDAFSAKRDIRKTISQKHILLRWCIWYTLLIMVIIWGIYGNQYIEANFIYEQF